MNMMNCKPELQQQIRRDKFRVERMNDFSNTWDYHYQNIKIPNNLGLNGILLNQNPVPVQTDAYQHCTTTFMNNNQGSSNWRSTDLSQPSSAVSYGYDQTSIKPSNIGDVFSKHFSSRNRILDRPLYLGRDTIAQTSLTSRTEVSNLEENQKGHVTVASSRSSYDQGSSSESYRGELMFLPSQWNQGSSCKEPLHTNKKDFSLSLSSDRAKLSPCGDGGNVAVSFNVPLGPLGPFTGYASILKSSRFLKPAQKMLEDFSLSYVSKIISSSESTSLGFDDSSGILSSTNHMVDAFSSSSKPFEANMRLKRAKLVFLQEEVCKWYKLYNHQLETVVSSFDSVAGLSSATPFISLAFRRVSRSFNALKTTISEELKQISSRYLIGGEDERYQKQQRYLISNNVGFAESQQHHHWRPQRGLPERGVTVLRAWLFDHFLHPYPTDTDKLMLATQTGLSRNQVSNWFINARVRLWKPMVEEIHMLETKAMTKADTTNMNSKQTNRLNIYSRPSCEQKLMNLPGTKRSRLEYDMDMMGFNRGLENVSLTLGLTHGVDNVIQTETQDHQFGTGGQMFHDFVG